MQPIRDPRLPPDLERYRRADHPRGRIIVIAPTRASCETIELALQTRIATVLEQRHGDTLRAWAAGGKAFGIVAGTGTGKTLGIRLIAEAILEQELRVGVVNREREATPETDLCNVVIVTTGIARRWLTDDLVTARDTILVDEIHQTSAELELCLALGKRIGCRFLWLSATVDPSFYRDYLAADEVLETSAFDPALRAHVTVVPQTPEGFLDDRTVRRLISERRGVAVFLPTRAEVERLGESMGSRFPKLTAAFYHGGEPIRVIRPFLEGEVRKPYLLAMTAAGQSALNLPGLDTVVIYDARYGNVVSGGRNVLHRLHLGANEILQMAGRVHGRVKGGEVTILSDRPLDFATLRPIPPEFQLAGDAERVALTCAALGVDATDLDLPVPLDRLAYRAAVALLTRRGIIADGRLTRYGHDVEALPVERPWAELLLHAEADMLPVVAAMAGVESLHRMTRDERDLHGVAVPGSDHLTAYHLLAEAVNAFGVIVEVHGLHRYAFEDEPFAQWAERRGVLVKAIEDASLAMASVYRAMGVALPRMLPRVTKEVRESFIDLVARVQPFALMIEELDANGEEVRIARSSLAGAWGAVAGTIRYFADRQGIARASIEGTTIPHALVQQYARWDPPELVLRGHRQHQGFASATMLRYGDFALEQRATRLTGPLPPEWREMGRDLLVQALLAGEAHHPRQDEIRRTLWQLREYWRRSGGVLRALSDASLAVLLAAQVGDVTSWDDFQSTDVHLDSDALIDAETRARLDALPVSLRLHGDAIPLVYELEQGTPIVRLHLREGQARRLRAEEVPVLDRPVHFAVRSGDGELRAATLAELHERLQARDRTRRVKPGARSGGHDGRRGGGGRRPGRGPRPPGRRGGRRR